MLKWKISYITTLFHSGTSSKLMLWNVMSIPMELPLTKIKEYLLESPSCHSGNSSVAPHYPGNV